MELQRVTRGLSHTMTEKFAAPFVLVVDDEGLIRWALRKALSSCGCDVREAADAGAAVRAVTEAEPPFDAVLLDLKLPDSADLSLLAALRTRLPAARIILMTAFGTDQTESDALKLGAFRVVRKPFDVKALAAMAVDWHG